VSSGLFSAPAAAPGSVFAGPGHDGPGRLARAPLLGRSGEVMMTTPMNKGEFTVGELARRLDGEVEGDASVMLRGVGSLESAGPDEVTFAVDARRAAALATSRAGAAIVGRQAPPARMPLIRVDDVQAAVAKLLALLGEPEDLPAPGIDPSAVVAKDARLGADVAIGPGAVVGARAELGPGVVVAPNAVVGAEARIGERTILYEGTVVVRGCRIGRRCRIGPNAVIGSSGFGYYFAQGQHHRIEHIGTVEIGDDVDIGACSCVDRAKFGATRIGDGTKIDNLVQVAHNVQLGPGCLLAALVGIGGSANLKNHVALGGHAAVRDNISIGAGVRVGAYSGIGHDVPDGAVVAGVPAVDARRWLRNVRVLARLTEMHERVRQLEKRVRALESSENH